MFARAVQAVTKEGELESGGKEEEEERNKERINASKQASRESHHFACARLDQTYEIH